MVGSFKGIKALGDPPLRTSKVNTGPLINYCSVESIFKGCIH